jgi:hypothetical protein
MIRAEIDAIRTNFARGFDFALAALKDAGHFYRQP